MQYTVIIEKEATTDWGAYVPDLPGCVAVAETPDEVEPEFQGNCGGGCGLSLPL